MTEQTQSTSVFRPCFHNHCLLLSGDLILLILRISIKYIRRRISVAQILKIAIFTHLSTDTAGLINLLNKSPGGTTVVMVFDLPSNAMLRTSLRVCKFRIGSWEVSLMMCRALEEIVDHGAIPDS